MTAEVTYGLERLASYIQEVDSVYDIEWADGVKIRRKSKSFIPTPPIQVVMKPSPSNIQRALPKVIGKLGINPLEHDIRFVEDNWENPSTGSAGLGWEVWLDGMEITQFTYFQQVGGLATGPVTAEVTYGLERLASYIQEVDSVYDIEWAPGVKIRRNIPQPEYEHSKYSFEVSDQDMLLENFEKFEKKQDVLWNWA